LTNRSIFKPGQQKTLRFIGSASAPHPIQLIEEFESVFKVNILEGYGMTEATCGITLNPVDRKKRKLGSVGKPLSINTVKIFDDKDSPLPPKKSGRIIVGGTNVAILPDQDSVTPGTMKSHKNRWLETGDIGYLDEDEFLWIESRKNCTLWSSSITSDC